MTSPFQTDDRTRVDPLVPVLEVLEALQAEDLLQQTFDRTFSTQLDRALFSLTGQGDPTPFQTDPTLPDPRNAGSVLERIQHDHDRAVQAVQYVLEHPESYPISAR